MCIHEFRKIRHLEVIYGDIKNRITCKNFCK